MKELFYSRIIFRVIFWKFDKRLLSFYGFGTDSGFKTMHAYIPE